MSLDPNLERLERAAELLGPLMDQLLLVGGCATGLLITDPGSAPIRATFDVDFVLEAIRYQEYASFEKQLTDRQFRPGHEEDDPICRFRREDLVLDVMASGNVHGFHNPWYPRAFEARLESRLPSGKRIQHVDGPHFVATKLVAFLDRGAEDPVTSHDAEDIVLVVDGRDSLLDEVAEAPDDLQEFIARGIAKLTGDSLFMDALEGFFERPIAFERAGIVGERLRMLARE